MRKLLQAWFVFGSLSAFAACSGSKDSLGVKADNQEGDGRCSGVDPSSLGCNDGACPSGMVCDPTACHSSHCSCDSETGHWECTADCGYGTCVPEHQPGACAGHNPATGCDHGCPNGSVCDPAACRPSSCSCDPATGGWICTDDCGSGGACVPDSGAPECTGPNPAAGCGDGCPPTLRCDPDACRPSHCGCDPATGHWQCTADCGSGGACVPLCGHDPSIGCEGGCPDGTACNPEACRPSQCNCDPATGEWACTRDCGARGICAPVP